MKRIKRALARALLISCRWIIRRLPYPVYKTFMGFFVFLGRCFMSRMEKFAYESLKIAFEGEKSEQEIQNIAKKCFNNFGRGMIDMIYFADRPDEILGKIAIEGKEHLDEALRKGKGAIIVSAHFGIFLLMYFRIVMEGYKTNVIMRRMRDSVFEQYISEFRNEKGLATIYSLPQRQCIEKSLRALRNNELLFILLDQNFGGDGRIFVDFFGKKAATAAGPAIFHQRTDAPIIPMFIFRESDTKHKIIIDKPLEFERNSNSTEEIIIIIQRITAIIEKYIRNAPHEWGGWMHKRWKTRTNEEQAVIDRLEKEGHTLASMSDRLKAAEDNTIDSII
ncbi:MAG: hypothetical protein HQL27_05370 [Candidatus Omnitrophica bacterium]|nr:hypothetical protein [Candidatus Omnitrophota bacterium]